MSRRRCQIMLAWAETLWGRKEGAAEEKGSNDPVTFDTVLQMQNGYSSRNLTKRARFDGNWYRQWPVAGSVGCLSASREAYQMTLKISSTTITLEGKRRTFHIRWAWMCARWKEQREASWSNYLLCALHWNRKGLLVDGQICSTAQRSLCIYPLAYIFCLSLFMSLVASSSTAMWAH